MHTITITTPQNIEFEYELASLGDRIVGHIIDYLIIIAYCITMMLTFVSNISNFTGTYIFIVILIFLPVVFYDLACEMLLNGQTPGKKVRDIKVISINGNQPSFSQYLNRWIFRLVDFSLSSNMVGLIMIAVTQKKQRLGDVIAGTVLVKTKLRTNLSDTWYEQNNITTYVVTYPEVSNLKDSDIQLIKEVIIAVRRSNNTMLSLQTQNKIEQILHIQSRQSDPMDFLQTVIKDYNHLTAQL